MLIAISQRQDKNKHGDFVDTLENNYINYLEKFGVKLIQIPNSSEDIRSYFKTPPIKGIILSGGNDIGESEQRDETEKKLLDIAVKRKLPVLGICRGMQFINHYFGGSLNHVENHVAQNHNIEIIDNKIGQSLKGQIKTNSYHTQGISSEGLSNQLKSFAQSSDLLIEGLYHPFLPIAGIQWHPERISPGNEINEKLIKAFLNKELFWKRKPKAIILAAGMGTRLGKYTENLPKCMLEFGGKTLIERQVETFRKCGINDIVIIRGNLGHKIDIPNVKYVEWSGPDTNMVIDFFQARHEFNEDIIMSYGDVIFEPEVLKKVIEFKGDVGIVADISWKDYWTARLGDWKKDSESFVIGENDKVISLGIENPSEKDMDARYVGLIKFSKEAWPKIKEIYDKNAEEFWNLPWYESKSFKKAYMTDFMQALIDAGLDVKAIKIQRSWMEFDTVDDYELALKWEKENTLVEFYNLEN